jgi:hypothetical protein
MNEFTPGLDVAFFKPRALYHTGLDDIRHASRGSLQHMLSTGLISVRNLANDVKHSKFAYGGQPVYFDFLAGNFAEMRIGILWIWDLLLLLFCPWILGYAFHVRIKKFGKVMLKGVGVASSAFIGGSVIVLGSMGLLCIHGAAVYPPAVLLMVARVCSPKCCTGILAPPHLYRILSHHSASLHLPACDPAKPR